MYRAHRSEGGPQCNRDHGQIGGLPGRENIWVSPLGVEEKLQV